MTDLPRPLAEGRITDAALLPLIGIGQAAALGLGAFATRDAFAALHSGAGPGMGTLVMLVAAGTLAAVFELVARRRGEALGQSFLRSMRLVLYSHIAGMDRRTLEARRLGGLSLRFVGDLTAARLWYGRGLPRLVTAAVVLPVAALVCWWLDPALALAAGVPVALSLLAMAALAASLRRMHVGLRRRRAAISITMMERIAMAPELDLMTRTDRELKALDAGGVELSGQSVARMTRVGLVRLVPQIGAAVAAAAVLASAAASDTAPAVVAAVLSVLAILLIPMREFATSWDEFCAWSVARERALVLLALPSRRRTVVARGKAVALTLEGVVIGDAVIVTEVAAGALLILAGPAGSGKSELAGIIAGLDRPAAGRVLYDGAEGPLPRIATLADRPVVLQGSLRRALTLGIAPRPPAAEVRRVTRAFGLSALVDHGGQMRARVGEAGRTQSQSETLRIELSRIVLSRPDLIVCDAPRLLADPERAVLIALLRAETGATMVLAVADGFSDEREMIVRLPERNVSVPVSDKDCPLA